MINELLHLTHNPEETWFIVTFFDEDEVANGYKNATETEKELLKEIGFTERFRMYTDDDDLIYAGLAKPSAEFDPLDDFGMPNYGCTTIKYFNKNTTRFERL